MLAVARAKFGGGLENDWLEALIALPEQLFYNTGIATYVWVLTNRKTPKRKDKVQLINATTFWTQMRRSLGNKRRKFLPNARKRSLRFSLTSKKASFQRFFRRRISAIARLLLSARSSSISKSRRNASRGSTKSPASRSSQ